MNESVVKLFSKLFEARQISQVFHLQVKAKMGSEAEHKALQIFYDEMGELTDDIIEIYQGQFGIVEGYEIIDPNSTRKTEPIGYMEDFVKYLEENRYKALPEKLSHLHNIVDEIIAITYHTLYRLKFLK